MFSNFKWYLISNHKLETYHISSTVPILSGIVIYEKKMLISLILKVCYLVNVTNFWANNKTLNMTIMMMIMMMFWSW